MTRCLDPTWPLNGLYRAYFILGTTLALQTVPISTIKGGKMRRLCVFLVLWGCGEGDLHAPVEGTEVSGLETVEEKSRLCESARINCEQMCFREYGRTWGNWSPTYNACMDVCAEQYEVCTHRPHPIEARTGFARKRTYSWDQPSSDGINGYYGYCGPTAAANLLMNTCGIRVSPRQISETAFSWTPGTTPHNLVAALNEIEGCGRWAVCHPSPHDGDVLGTLEKLMPVATLMDWDGALDLHWITVVDVRRTAGSCHLVYNHWGRQQRMECNEFLTRWSLVETTLGSTSVATRALEPFTFVCRTGP